MQDGDDSTSLASQCNLSHIGLLINWCRSNYFQQLMYITRQI